MSKKNFIALADTLRVRGIQIKSRYAESPLHGTVAQREHDETVHALADFCAAQNPAFDRARWIGYIKGENGPNGGKV